MSRRKFADSLKSKLNKRDFIKKYNIIQFGDHNCEFLYGQTESIVSNSRSLESDIISIKRTAAQFN